MGAALARRGIPFVIFEANDDVGGNWYRGVYDGVRLISSRATTELPGFPMPRDYPDFPTRAQMLEYLQAYCEEHGLRRHIRFETTVRRVAPDAAHARFARETRWRVETDDGTVETFDGLIVANGHHWDPRLPAYPGELGIELLHARSYRTPDIFEGKRVLVIGGGNSACDIAVEAARDAGADTHISMRRGYWFMPRALFGVPTVELFKPWIPIPVQRVLLRGALRMTLGDYRDYGLQHPDHRIFDHHPVINTTLLDELRAGTVVPHPDIERWDGDEVTFVDGTRERFDLIVAATGYHLSFPFFDEDLIAWDGDIPQLIGGLSPEHANLYVFGLGQARYGAGPIAGRGAEAVATAIEVQRRLERPVGRVLWDLGLRPPRTFLIDPHRAMALIDAGRFVVLPALPRLDPLLRRLGAATTVKSTGERADPAPT